MVNSTTQWFVNKYFCTRTKLAKRNRNNLMFSSFHSDFSTPEFNILFKVQWTQVEKQLREKMWCLCPCPRFRVLLCHCPQSRLFQAMLFNKIFKMSTISNRASPCLLLTESNQVNIKTRNTMYSETPDTQGLKLYYS